MCGCVKYLFISGFSLFHFKRLWVNKTNVKVFFLVAELCVRGTSFTDNGPLGNMTW